ncbi:Os03g0808750, partial [Oryza sativa Japonica Group]
MFGCDGMWRMISTSRRTSSTSTGVRSFRFDIDLHAYLSPVSASVHRYVIPNSPRPSSPPSSYRAPRSRPVGSRSTISPGLPAAAPADDGARLYATVKGFAFFC